ncbi:DUF4290 domain-containing protein [Aquirufa rosea]|uniref:DUF4290 domain-containing protein n=1 Tax=Aquirufa rosea TaxID=2509241 RepID=A0A4Q1C329_9BACT|nr:DUF4290 domain-containing protein [Aquirufa rosea]RXK52607.1 DUF4290 domain-containing protein [Aquirufa rosea]
MKEYGSSVQKLVDYILTVQDRDKRTKYAFLMVELMKQIHPGMKDNSQDYSKKLWDDLYIMSNFQLDVQGPYPPPSPESVGKAPKKVNYNQHHLKFKHYGRNVELLILRAIAEEKLEDKKILVAYIARLMKGFYVTWNKDSVDDQVIWQNIKEMSENLLANIVDELSQEGLGHAKVANNARNAYNAPEYPNGSNNRGGNNYRKNFRNNRNFNSRNHKK